MEAGTSRSGVTNGGVGNLTAGGHRWDGNGCGAVEGEGASMTLVSLCTWSRKLLQDGGAGDVGRNKGEGSPNSEEEADGEKPHPAVRRYVGL